MVITTMCFTRKTDRADSLSTAWGGLGRSSDELQCKALERYRRHLRRLKVRKARLIEGYVNDNSSLRAHGELCVSRR